jgi:hypothetical protein
MGINGNYVMSTLPRGARTHQAKSGKKHGGTMLRLMNEISDILKAASISCDMS